MFKFQVTDNIRLIWYIWIYLNVQVSSNGQHQIDLIHLNLSKCSSNKEWTHQIDLIHLDLHVSKFSQDTASLDGNKANGKCCLACSLQAPYKQLAGNGKLNNPWSLTLGMSNCLWVTLHTKDRHQVSKQSVILYWNQSHQIMTMQTSTWDVDAAAAKYSDAYVSHLLCRRDKMLKICINPAPKLTYFISTTLTMFCEWHLLTFFNFNWNFQLAWILKLIIVFSFFLQVVPWHLTTENEYV